MDWSRILGLSRAVLFIAILLVAPPAHSQESLRSSGLILNSATSNAALTIPPLFGAQGVIAFNVTGLTASGAVLTIEGSTDAQPQSSSTKTWAAINGYALPGGSTTGFTSVAADKAFRVDIAGLTDIRLRVSSTGTGNIIIGYQAIPGVTLQNWGATGGGGGGGTVTPQTGPFTFPGCTVGITSAQCLAASVATNHIQIQNASATASVACAWGAAAVLNSSSSVQLAPGQPANWGFPTSGIPSGALNCISSAASTPLYLEYN